MSFGSGGTDVYLIRTDASGDALWTRTYGGPGDDEGWSARQTSDGFIVFGSTASFGSGGSDVYLIKTDAAGDTLWTRTCGGTGDDKGYSGELTFDGGVRRRRRDHIFRRRRQRRYLIRTDASGETLWTRTYGGANSDWGYSVEQTSDSGYIVVGQTYSLGSGNSDVYLVKTDAQGNSAVEEGPGSPARFRPELLLSVAPSPRGARHDPALSPPAGSRSACWKSWTQRAVSFAHSAPSACFTKAPLSTHGTATTTRAGRCLRAAISASCGRRVRLRRRNCFWCDSLRFLPAAPGLSQTRSLSAWPIRESLTSDSSAATPRAAMTGRIQDRAALPGTGCLACDCESRRHPEKSAAPVSRRKARARIRLDSPDRVRIISKLAKRRAETATEELTE